jgi:predicted permease
MGGNSALAANIVALTTVGSLFTTSAGIVVLKGMGLM